MCLMVVLSELLVFPVEIETYLLMSKRFDRFLKDVTKNTTSNIAPNDTSVEVGSIE